MRYIDAAFLAKKGDAAFAIIVVGLFYIVISGWATRSMTGKKTLPLIWYLLGLILAPIFVPLALLKFIFEADIAGNFFSGDD